MELTYIKQSGEPVGDGGDQYTGLDRFGRVVDQRWLDSGGADMERVDYGFTPASNRQWRQNRVAAGGQDEYYTYDGIYQVAELQRGTLNSGKTGIAGTPSWQEDFTYDPIGNWDDYLTKVSGVTNLDQSRTHNKANETTAIDGSSATVGEDPAGNMVKVPQVDDWSSAYDLKWDAWNRLVEVVDGSTTVAIYRYDGNTRRTTKTTTETRHYYYSDQWQIMEERLNSGTTADRQFVWGQRFTDDLVLRDRGSERLYVLSDYFNPTAIADPSETVLERYGYNAFGLSRVMAPDFSDRSTSLYDWETRFGAYRYDPETGFYQVRYRYLHPTLGRWISRDPIEEDGGANLYVYSLDNPVNSADPIGLRASGCSESELIIWFFLPSYESRRAWTRFIGGSGFDIQLTETEMWSLLDNAPKVKSKLDRLRKKCCSTGCSWPYFELTIGDSAGGPWTKAIGGFAAKLGTSCSDGNFKWSFSIRDFYDFDLWPGYIRDLSGQTEVTVVWILQHVIECGWKEFNHVGYLSQTEPCD